MILPPRYVSSTSSFQNGGMSDATLCTDTHLDRPVLIKRLAPGTDARRLLDEIEALQVIRSKHVVQIYDIIKNARGEITAIVEEYLPGKDLTEVPVPDLADDFMRLLFAMAEGISDIHNHGRVHRDIKRQNMKFDAEGCLKIFDFGLAKDQSDASTVGAWGTPGYMAPELFEQSAGGRTIFTAAIDTFAFGATALAVAKGSIPKELRAMPPSLPVASADFATVRPHLPDEIISALNSCLDRIPARRPDMRNVAKLVGQYLLRDRHRALLSSNGKNYHLDKDKREIRLSVKDQGSLAIKYDGLRFVVDGAQGHIAINNVAAVSGAVLPGSCVIVLGPAELGPRRTNITVDVSHPEVVL